MDRSNVKESNMRRLHLHAKTVTVIVALLGTWTLHAAPAIGASAPSISKVTSTLGTDNTLQVCWKESKLDKNRDIDYLASAIASATYRCVAPAGVCPGAIDPVIITGLPVTSPGTFTSGKNGQVTACLTIDAPTATDDCGGPLTLTLTDISYTAIEIEDLTTPIGPVLATPSTISAVVFVCP
jgi:hypothetical protein